MCLVEILLDVKKSREGKEYTYLITHIVYAL